MEPLPLKTRRLYSFISFILFATVLAIAALYASGYRLDGLSLVGTGGIHISVPVSDAEVLLNGEEVGKTGFLSRSFFIDNLNPGTYVIQVEAEDFYSWTKTLVVERRVVSDTNAFLVPQGLSTIEVVATTSRNVATTTRGVTQREYDELLFLFETPTTTPEIVDIATSTPEDTDGGISLYVEEGDVFVRWERGIEKAPSAFCLAPSACFSQVSIERGREITTRASLFRGGVVYETQGSGIFFSEIDVKPVQTIVPLYSRADATFRVHEGDILIKDENNLFVIVGF